jgi:hypothetical protein
MNDYVEERPVSILRRHCAMYEYGAVVSGSAALGKAGSDFFLFAATHLIDTMFIAADEPGGAPGVFHRVLDPMGRGDLLDGVDEALDSPVGATTLREYLRSKRDSLALHGALSWASQPREVRDVNSDEIALQQSSEAMAELLDAVALLDKELARLDE